MPWSKKFREPIPLPNGQKLVTLADAGQHILKLSDEKGVTEAWMLAAEMLIKAAEEGGGWIDLASIGIMQAINGPRPPPEPGARSASKKRRRR
ncbi:MAG TPA: hypothetical protein VNZ94_01620 [Xanthobacteraceae bacterium]|nr:hypothetical protein [Xanthobacteraceae bacterium]